MSNKSQGTDRHEFFPNDTFHKFYQKTSLKNRKIQLKKNSFEIEHIRTPVRPVMAMTELFTTKCMLKQDLRGEYVSEILGTVTDYLGTSDRYLSSQDLLYQLFTAFQNRSSTSHHGD